MELKWLEDFLSLVDSRNFTRSAELRFTTQPAFSRRIRSLEEWVGTALIERTTQPISLTPAGQKFRPAAEEILRRLFQVRENIRRIDRTSANTISFTATHSLSLNFFPRWIQAVEQRKGVLFTRLDSNHAEDCVQALSKGHVHFMLSICTYPLTVSVLWSSGMTDCCQFPCQMHKAIQCMRFPEHASILRLTSLTLRPPPSDARSSIYWSNVPSSLNWSESLFRIWRRYLNLWCVLDEGLPGFLKVRSRMTCLMGSWLSQATKNGAFP